MPSTSKTGKQLWTEKLGTLQKSSPVLADGKLYVGTENGKFFIIRPHPDKAEVLDSDQLGTEDNPEAIIGSPAVARGRVYVASMVGLYAIGPKGTPRPTSSGGAGVAGAAGTSGTTPAAPPQSGPATIILVTPTDLILKPGESTTLSIKAFDEMGHAVASPGQATWALEGLKGTIDNGKFTADAANVAQAGTVKATVGSLSGGSRIRVLPPMPWTFDFEDGKETPPAQWVNATGKFAVRDLDGSKVLVKLAENPFAFAKRCRPFFSGVEYSDYTIEADVRAMEKRRQVGDIGVVAQRYELVLFGNQHLDLQPWQPEIKRTVHVPFKWDKDTWYTMKLEVQTMGAGKVRARGKVWPKGQPEPTAWSVERIDPIGNLKGAPGIYADAPSAAGGGSELYWDNIKIYKNK